MKVNLNVASYDSAEGANEVVHLTRVRATDGISDTNSVDTNLVDGLVNGEKVDKIGPEGIFGRESDFDACTKITGISTSPCPPSMADSPLL